MGRSKQEIISEMVDSGLFSDDEIRQAVRGAGGQEKGYMGKAWDALAVPEKLSREGLGKIAGMVPTPEPTGNLPLDIAKGTPKIAVDTIAEAAPSFVSRGSLVASGALGAAKASSPLIKALGGKAAQAAESISGLEYKTPGVLQEAAKDASLIFGKGKEAAKPLYSAAESGGKAKGTFEGMYKPDQIVDKTLAIFKEGGDKFLTPTEAHQARKAVDRLMQSGQYVKDELIVLREKLDKIAKMSEGIKEADRVYSRGRMSDALRLFLPVNKSGGTSIAKSVLASIKGVGTLGLTSPVVQGTTATALGAMARAAGKFSDKPFTMGSAIGASIERLKKRK